jgi:cytochrome c peroxidase
MPRRLWWSSFLFVFGVIGCTTPPTTTKQDRPVHFRIPSHLPPMVHPTDNEPTEARLEFGRRLFYHTALSQNETNSCASCHVQSAAFTDGRVTSPGLNGDAGVRNTPTLANLAWSPYLMSEGGVPSLELQALAPLHEPLEMGMNMMIAVDRLNQDAYLRTLNQRAYGRDSIDPFTITRALACFQRSLISGDSKYDQYKMGAAELTAKEAKGLALFFEVGCANCHREPFFTDYGFYNIGLYSVSTDPGLERKTHIKSDSGKFKTPTLRNIAVTGPYMHDGSMSSLEEVIAFYNAGGTGARLQDERIRALHLSAEDEEALIAFLETLTDWNFLQNQQFTPLSE